MKSGGITMGEHIAGENEFPREERDHSGSRGGSFAAFVRLMVRKLSPSE